MESAQIRPLRREDNPAVAQLIRTVMPEFGASGPGFAIVDPEVDDMYGTYTQPRSAYWVLERAGRLIGGGGVAPLIGAEPGICELRKMYFLPEARGGGFGQQLIELCLAEARRFGFTQCYLETLTHMTAAQRLYRKNGFESLPAPLGATGHYGCDRWFARNL